MGYLVYSTDILQYRIYSFDLYFFNKVSDFILGLIVTVFIVVFFFKRHLFKVKNKITSKAPIQQLKRQTTSVVKRFVILLILNPKLIEKSDKDISWGESLDEQLAQACISKILVDKFSCFIFKDTSSLLFIIFNKFATTLNKIKFYEARFVRSTRLLQFRRTPN